MRDDRGASFAREATFTDPQRDRLRANPEWPGSGASVIVLLGGDDYFSNGINLAVIEAAEDPAAESWRNLVAIDDLVREIVETDSHLVISALAGDTAAGGVPLALAGDYVVGREDIVLNPYYGTWAGCTDRSTGLTCCLGRSGPR